MSSRAVKIVECPRDAWQGIPRLIPASEKAAWLKRLIEAGFRHLDAVSFVSPKAVPQTADSEEVLRLLSPPPDVEIIGIVMNARGAERARDTGFVTTVGFPLSVSPTFGMRNQRQTPAESLEELERIQAVGLPLTVYISMAFGNPYGDEWSAELVREALGNVAALGIKSVSLADTVGLATPAEVAALFGEVTREFPDLEIGAHLHSRHEGIREKVLAAFDSGCRRFDCAIGGMGGCPFAQDYKVGNLDTAVVLSALTERGVANGIGPLPPPVVFGV